MPSGYDCISYGFGTSKNVMTVGAVFGIPNGYTSPSDVVHASFSSTGPTDDGRIKPDIVADGVGLYSTWSTADNAYGGLTGTSMATPNVTGSLALLQQYYFNLHGIYMHAATLKGLAIHTADEAGPAPGPDYKFGWGLLDISKAASVLRSTFTALVKEATLINGQTYTLNFKSNGTEPVRATLSWTDPPGTPPPPSLNPPAIMLVNDLDLRIDGTAYKPWILDPANPSAAATTGDNIRDNVEQVLLPSLPAGCHSLTITHKGTLSGGSQDFSLILTGITVYPPLTAGTISGNQNICYNTAPSLITGVSPTGGNPPYTYQWQSSPDSITFTDIPAASGISYQPGMMTATTWYRQVQLSAGSCDNAITNVVKVKVNALPTPSITGPQNPCINSGYNNYSTEDGMAGYTWLVSAGGAITGGPGTNSVQVVWNNPGNQSVSISYTNAFGCTPVAATVLPVIVNPLPGPAGTITGTSVVCSGISGVSYSITPISNAVSYVWTLPSGVTISSGMWTNSILTDFASNAVSGNFSALGNNLCGNGTSSPNYPVTVNHVPPQPVIIQSGDSIISDASEGNQWYDNSGAISGATSQVYMPPVDGMYMDVVTLNGCASVPSAWLPFVIAGVNTSSRPLFRIYPNPATNNICFETFLNRPTNIIAVLMSLTGTKLKTIDLGNQTKGIARLIVDCDDVREGIYFLKVTTSYDSFVQKVILKK
jgi:hypothetical protein